MKIFIYKEKVIIRPKIKKLKTIFILILLLMVSLSYEEQKKEYLDNSYEIVNKANNLRSRYWGIEYYFEFVRFYTKRDEQQYKSLDLDSLEFQEYLQSQYTMFRLGKSKLFAQISRVCIDIFKYQLKTQDIIFIKQLANHATMAIIKTLNNNIIGENEIDAIRVNSEFNKKYGATTMTPLNIFQILVDSKVLILKENIYSYENPGTYFFFEYSSKNLMPMIKKKTVT